jgi:hypothetical protein
MCRRPRDCVTFAQVPARRAPRPPYVSPDGGQTDLRPGLQSQRTVDEASPFPDVIMGSRSDRNEYRWSRHRRATRHQFMSRCPRHPEVRTRGYCPTRGRLPVHAGPGNPGEWQRTHVYRMLVYSSGTQTDEPPPEGASHRRKRSHNPSRSFVVHTSPSRRGGRQRAVSTGNPLTRLDGMHCNPS